jgi:hypothetical protein
LATEKAMLLLVEFSSVKIPELRSTPSSRATELAGSDLSIYTLMKPLGHESMTASQRYVAAGDTETRSAAARNPLYAMIAAVTRPPAGGQHQPTRRQRFLPRTGVSR